MNKLKPNPFVPPDNDNMALTTLATNNVKLWNIILFLCKSLGSENTILKKSFVTKGPTE
jgi:hypothetical protein